METAPGPPATGTHLAEPASGQVPIHRAIVRLNAAAAHQIGRLSIIVTRISSAQAGPSPVHPRSIHHFGEAVSLVRMKIQVH
jgi:hypothetical protein